VDGFKPSGLSVVLFVASFHEACKPGGQMDTVFHHLSGKQLNVNFYKVDAEELSDLAEEFGVEVVPTVLFLKDRTVAEKVEGAHPAKVSHSARCKIVDRDGGGGSGYGHRGLELTFPSSSSEI